MDTYLYDDRGHTQERFKEQERDFANNIKVTLFVHQRKRSFVMKMSLCNTNEYDLIACVCVDYIYIYIYYCRTHKHTPTLQSYPYYTWLLRTNWHQWSIQEQSDWWTGGCDESFAFLLYGSLQLALD